MNWVKTNRIQLEESNYVLKADANSNYWFGISRGKLDEYKGRAGLKFNIILFGSDVEESDFYCIPFKSIEDLLVEENLYFFEGERKRWVGDIRNHNLRIRNSGRERNVVEFFSLPPVPLGSVLHEDNLNDYAVESAKREIKVRVKQSTFRRKVLENFHHQCCLTGVSESELLVASHIVPWATKIETRLSPHNGLCLSVLYDSLFDAGYFTFNEVNEVILTPRLARLSEQTQYWLVQVLGRKIATPKKYEISRSALAYHHNYIFDKFRE